MSDDPKMFGSGAADLPKWFEVESVSDPSKNETVITVKISASNGATAIPLVHRLPKGVITGVDLLTAMKVKPPANLLGKGLWFAAGMLQLPVRMHITGEPVADKNDQARLSLACTHAGNRYNWHKDIEFDRVRLADMADMLKFLALLQTGQAVPSV